MSNSRYSLHVSEREPGAGSRVLHVSTFDDSPLPEGTSPTYDVSSTEDVRQIAASLGMELSRVKFAGGDFEHEAAGEQ
jgi:hypothetical protein